MQVIMWELIVLLKERLEKGHERNPTKYQGAAKKKADIRAITEFEEKAIG